MANETKKIVVVGDGAVGKTCIIYSYFNGSFKTDYIPTIFEHEVFTLKMNRETYTVTLIDTAGQEELERLRKIFYKDASCFILCYSVDSKTSFENIETKWIPELRAASPHIPIILVGTKCDLHNHALSTYDGEQLKKRINANEFIECSAKLNLHINDVIHEALKASIDGVPENIQTNNCCCGLF